MGLARNLSKFKPNADGLVEAGDIAVGAVSSEALKKFYPLKAGTSVVAGNVVSLNSSGEVGALPVANTFGTEVSNAGTSASYSQLSLDGSRAIIVSTTRPNTTSGTVTFSGVALTGNSNATNGTTSQTLSLSVSGGDTVVDTPTFFNVYPISATTFLAMGAIKTGYNQAGITNYMQLKLTVITVDASGNVTKGAESTFNNTSSTFNFSGYATLSQISSSIFVMQWGANGDQVLNYAISVSGTTITVNTNDAEAAQFLNATIFSTCVTSSNIICLPIGTSIRTATITSNNIGTVTNTTVINDALNTPIWYKINNSDRFIAHYLDSLSQWKLQTFTINQTTGALSLVSTSTDINLVPASAITFFIFKSNTEGIFINGTSVNSISLDASANILGGNILTSVGSFAVIPRYNTGDIFYLNYYSSTTSNQKLRTYTVSAYKTDAFIYNGVSTTSSSTSPVEIITDGIVGGYTNLTINGKYYVAQPITGAITTAVTTAGYVGRAISATEILLGY